MLLGMIDAPSQRVETGSGRRDLILEGLEKTDRCHRSLGWGEQKVCRMYGYQVVYPGEKVLRLCSNTVLQVPPCA